MTNKVKTHWELWFKVALVSFNVVGISAGYFWASQFEIKFNRFHEDLRGEFVTQKDAEMILARKAELATVEALAKLHEADSDIHLQRSDVVTKDLYQSNRLADRQDVSDLKKDLHSISEKLDRLIEMRISAGP